MGWIISLTFLPTPLQFSTLAHYAHQPKYIISWIFTLGSSDALGLHLGKSVRKYFR